MMQGTPPWSPRSIDPGQAGELWTTGPQGQKAPHLGVQDRIEFQPHCIITESLSRERNTQVKNHVYKAHTGSSAHRHKASWENEAHGIQILLLTNVDPGQFRVLGFRDKERQKMKSRKHFHSDWKTAPKKPSLPNSHKRHSSAGIPVFRVNIFYVLRVRVPLSPANRPSDSPDSIPKYPVTHTVT